MGVIKWIFIIGAVIVVLMLGLIIGKSCFSKRIKIGGSLKTLVLLGIIAALFLMGALLAITNTAIFATSEENNDTQVVQALTKEEQVVLVNLGIAEIYDESKVTTIFGTSVFGTTRSKYLQAEFDAKLGLDGKNVEISQTGSNSYQISIPEFIFIGHSNENFEVIVENGGLLSFVTPDISESEMINDILNSSAQTEYIEKYQDLLEEAATDFYTNIVTSINEEATLHFEFPQAASE